MSNKTQLVVIEETSYAMSVRQDQIDGLGDALMSYHPEAEKAGVAVMRNVAALALATGANPLPGGLNGIHVWDNKGKIQVSLGEGFWSGLTKNHGGVVWMFQPRPMTEQERKDWAVMQGDIAFICAGCLGHHLRDHIRESVQSGIPITRAEAKEELCQYGTAIVKNSDYEKAGRSKGWTADKRAAMALFKKLVPAGAINQNRRVAPDGRGLGGEGWDVAEFVKPALPSNVGSKSVNEINGDLFDSPVEIHEGETIDHADPETGDQPKQGHAPKVEPPTVDPKKVWWGTLTENEKTVYQTPSKFVPVVMKASQHYKAAEHVIGALKKFGFEAVPFVKDETSGKLRIDLLHKLVDYGTARDQGMDSEAALNALQAIYNPNDDDDLFHGDELEGTQLGNNPDVTF